MKIDRTLCYVLYGIRDIQPPRGVFWVAQIEYQTVIIMAECSINAVRHNPKELEVTLNEIRWKYIRRLVSRLNLVVRK